MATMDQYLPRDSAPFVGESMDVSLLPRPLNPSSDCRGDGDRIDCEPVAVRSQCMLGVSREAPFDVHQNASESGASPRVLDTLPGCQYHITSYDEENNRSDFSPAYGIHLHDPRLLEYVGAPESARLLSHTPEYWLHHMGCEIPLAAALQRQHDAGLVMSNIQVIGQFVTSFNRMSLEVMRVAFDWGPFSYYRLATMGLWRPPCTQGVHGPLPSSSCNACMSCSDCFPDLPK